MSAVVKPTKLSTDEKRALLARLLQKKAGTLKSFPLSFAQQRLWILDQLEPGGFAYNMPTAMQLTGKLDLAALEQTLNEIVRRHEVLHTTFPMLDGQPVQLIAPAQPIHLPIHDLSELPGDEREAETQRRVHEEALRPFDLARGPLLRIQLLRLADDEHVLLVTMHHIISDGWSLGIFVNELGKLYEAFAAHMPSPLPELPIQYADFAAWQRKHVQGDLLDSQLAYWRAQLGSDLPVLALPTDQPRPSVQTFRGTSYSFTLPQFLSEQIKALSQQTGTTLFMTLLAAFKTLLYRYSGQADIVVGTLIAGRTRAEIEGLIGFFLNTLALRSDLSGNPSYRALLEHIREATLGAYAHQDLPVERLIEALQPERNLSHNPLFQVMFVLQNAPLGALELPGLTIKLLNRKKQNSAFDLTLYMVDADQRLSGSLEYSTDLFDDAMIARMLGHFQTLLEGIVAQPDQRLLDLPLLSAEQRRQILVDWNDTARVVPQDRGIHELIAAQATRTPDAIALVYETKDERRRTNGESASCVLHLTYAELDRRANQLAWHLRGLGIGPDIPVGICVARSPALLIGLLGILKAGGAYLPLDPHYPAERLAAMLADARAPVLVLALQDEGRRTEDEAADSAFGVRRSAFGAQQVVDLHADWPQIARSPATAPRSGVTPDNLAYVIYTSGSTGTPKGVMIAHRSLVSYACVAGSDYAIQPEDRVLQFSSISWDTSAEEIYPCLTHGATLVLRSAAMLDSMALFLRMCDAYAISVLNLPTAFWHELALQLREQALTIPAIVRLLIIGGERALAERIISWHAQVGPRVELVNTYGATEATAVSTLGGLTVGLVTTPLREVPIGCAIGNVQVYVLDRHMQPPPIGVVGELYIGGAGLARGYLSRPDLTAVRFVPNPFLEMNDERRTTNDDRALVDRPFVLRPSSFVRLYKTGDLARFRPDGLIEYFGRSDQQIKLRGIRIEPGEIQAALNRHPAVRDSVVVLHEDATSGKRLVAYVVTTNDERRTTSAAERDPSFVLRPASFAIELRDFLKKQLPDYMIPAAFGILAELPLTPNGKLDRRALPALDLAHALQAKPFAAPRTPVEQALAQIWCHLLGLKVVGIHNNFFALGGHSLLATQVVARVRDAMQIELPLRSLFESPTIAELALVITQRQGQDRATIPISWQPRERNIFPVSFAQQRLWFLDQFAPGNPFYNLFSAWRLTGSLSRPALARSLNELVRRHEILRTRFVTTDGRPAQAIIPMLTLALRLFDLGALPQPQREPLMQRLGREEAQRPFDLTRVPLLRVTLVQLAAHDHVLFLTIHHIISDGWSTALIVRELATLYEAFAEGRPSPLADLPIQYADYAVWQREWLASADDPDQPSPLQSQLAYWRTQLAGLPTLDLPSDRPRPPVQTFRGARYEFTLPAPLTEALRALCLSERVTAFMLLLAAFDILLARYSGQDDIVIGTPIANRHHSETEQLIGFFVNTLVLRSDLAGDPTVRELLIRVRKLTMGAYAHQDLPFERLVEELQPERDVSRTPLFQVMLVLNNIPTSMVQLDRVDLTLSNFGVDSETTNFDITFNLNDLPEGLYGWLSYNSDLFDAPTIMRMVGHFQTLLAGIVAEPGRRIAELPLLTAPERAQLTVEWNDTTVGVRRRGLAGGGIADACLHALFARQAAQAPDAVALVGGETNDGGRRTTDEGPDSACALHLTYAELNQRANQLAGYLRARGVGPDVLVGICLERSPALVIALLGVLQAGGAYVPLDPAYPAERIAFMLEDSQAALLISVTGAGRRTQDKATHAESLHDLGLTINDMRAAETPIVNRQAKIVHVDNLAYMIYTSGSTGRPKGALNSHRGVINRLLWMQDTYALDGSDRVLQKTPFSFDVSVWEFFWPLISGAALVLARPGGHQDAPYLARLIDAQRITTLHFVPSMLQAFVAARLAARGVKRVFCSGEALAFDLQARFLAQTDAELHNLYGPTEAAIDVTAWPCSRDDNRQPVPIGRPIANTQIYLLDRQLQPVPVGVPGELFIGGVQLARGYHRRPDLTAERFVPNPFAQTNDERRMTNDEDSDQFVLRPASCVRLYATGDLARFRPDGAIEFLGRRDQQVKLRGFRIELGEIEAALRQHPAVRASAVVVREDTPGDARLVAYVVPAEDERRTTNDERAEDERRTTNDERADASFVPRPSSLAPELRDFLAARLPAYMVPSAFVLLDALPTTPNGKLDHRALPAPGHVRSEPEDTFVAPRTGIEQEVARIWGELLGVERVGVNDNFFALGGHSLLMTQIVSRIWAALDVEVPIQSFFQDPTVAGLALKITQLRAAQHDDGTISRLLEQIDQLSHEELQSLIGQPPAAPEAPALPIAIIEPAPRGVSADERYRSAALTRFAIGDQQALLYSRDRRAAQVVPVATADLLDRCGRFATLDAHARTCAGDRADADAITAMRQRLEALAGAGLLLAEGAFLDQITPRPAAPPPATQITAVGFPTSDRIPALQRALISYIEQRQHYERTHDFVVVDDARNAATRSAGRAMLSALQQRYDVPIRYAGLEEKTSFAQRLIEAGDLPPDIVNFALFGEQLGVGTLGANRNGLLLDTVGETIFSADDDTICRLTAAPARDERLALVSGRVPLDTWAFRDREALLRSIRFVEADVLALHEQLLGQDPRRIIAASHASAGVDYAQANADMLQRLDAGAGRVVVTLNGLLGDCGWGSPANYLFFSGASFERLTSDEATYRAACISREILHVAPGVVIADRADDLMTTFFGLDNRTLVPPFVTIGRGSDAIFGMMLGRCFDDSYFAHLPWALLHSPAEPRAFWPGEIVRSATGINITLLLTILIRSFAPVARLRDGAEGLRRLGLHIEQLARMPEADFEEFLRLQLWQVASAQLVGLEALLDERGAAPGYWANDLSAYMGLLRQSLNNPELALPLELLPGRSLSEACALRQRLALTFGQLFAWWPAIMETARELRAQGDRLTRPL
jgi:amino acid adenylation domain-containing protein